MDRTSPPPCGPSGATRTSRTSQRASITSSSRGWADLGRQVRGGWPAGDPRERPGGAAPNLGTSFRSCLVAIHAATRWLSVLGLILFLPGLSLLLLGAAHTRRLALPLTLGIFLIPVPNVFASPLGLRAITAHGTEALLSLSSFPVVLDFLRFDLADGKSYLVSDNCAGFQLLLAGLAMAVTFASTTGSPVRRALLFVAVLPLTVAANALRSALLVGLAASVGSHVLEVPLVHGGTGVFAFWIVFAGMLALADWRGLRTDLA